MKRLNLWLIALAATILGSCTLYMDDAPSDESPKRVGEGYTSEVHVNQDNIDMTYKYSQNTIAVNDEVDAYIVRVEEDTILYFRKDTPPEYLPNVGEMLACGKRERFPIGLGHKVIERQELDDTYRCTLTLVDDIFDMFDVLEYTATFYPEGSDSLSAEEKQEISEKLHDLTPVEGASSRRRTRAGSVPLDALDEIDNGGKDDYLSFNKKGMSVELESADGRPVQLGCKLTVDAGVYGGMLWKEYVSKSQGYKRYDNIFVIGFELGFNYEITAAIKLRPKSPLFSKTIGIPDWFPFVKANAGARLYPFVSPQISFSGNIGWGGGISFSYIREEWSNPEKDDWDIDFGLYSRKNNAGKGFNCSLLNLAPKFTIDAGLDIEVGGEFGWRSSKKLGFTVSPTFRLEVDQVNNAKQLVDFNTTNINSTFIENMTVPVSMFFNIHDDFSNKVIVEENKIKIKGFEQDLSFLLPWTIWNFSYLPQLKHFSLVPENTSDGHVKDFKLTYGWSKEVSSWPPFVYDFKPGVFVMKKEDYERDPYPYSESFNPYQKDRWVTSRYGFRVWYTSLGDDALEFFQDGHTITLPSTEFSPNTEYVALPMIRAAISNEEVKYVIAGEGHTYSHNLWYEPYPFHASEPTVRVDTKDGQGIKLVRCERGSFKFGDTVYEYKYKFRTDVYADAVLGNKAVQNWGVEFGGTVNIPDFDYSGLTVTYPSNTKKFSIYTYCYSKRPLENATLTAQPYYVYKQDISGNNNKTKKVYKDKETLVYSYDQQLEAKEKDLPQWGTEVDDDNKKNEWTEMAFNIATENGGKGVVITKIDQGKFQYTPRIERKSTRPDGWSYGSAQTYYFRYKVRIDLQIENLVGEAFVLFLKLKTKNKISVFHTILDKSARFTDGTVYTYVYSNDALFEDENAQLTVEAKRLAVTKNTTYSFEMDWLKMDERTIPIYYDASLEAKELSLSPYGNYIYDETKYPRQGEKEIK